MPCHHGRYMGCFLVLWRKMTAVFRERAVFHFVLSIVEGRYNAVYFIMMLHTTLQRQQQNTNQIMNSQKTPHTSPVWVSVVRIWETIDRVITEPPCTCCRYDIESISKPTVVSTPASDDAPYDATIIVDMYRHYYNIVWMAIVTFVPVQNEEKLRHVG